MQKEIFAIVEPACRSHEYIIERPRDSALMVEKRAFGFSRIDSILCITSIPYTKNDIYACSQYAHVGPPFFAISFKSIN